MNVLQVSNLWHKAPCEHVCVSYL